MAEKRIFEGRVSLGYDKESKWKANSDYITLKPGELISMKLTPSLSNEIPSKYALLLGTEDSTDIKTIMGTKSQYKDSNCFFSGIGAGYQLPIAGNDVTHDIGGIKINDDTYFQINQSNGVLTPSFLRFQNTNHGDSYIINNGYDLVVEGSLYCNEIVGERVVEIENFLNRTPSEYIELNIYSTIEGEGGENYTTVLGDNERSGFKFHNYLGAESEVADPADRTVAELSIDNKGILSYGTNAKDSNTFRQVLTLDRRNDEEITETKYLCVTETSDSGYIVDYTTSIPVQDLEEVKTLTLTIDGDHASSQVYSPQNSSDLKYNIAIPRTYCKTIEIEGTKYSVDGEGNKTDHNIKLPIKAFTAAKEQTLNSALQSITLNGIEVKGPNAELPPIKGSSKLSVSSNKSAITINHEEPTGFQKYENIEVSTDYEGKIVTNVKYDDTGHVINYSFYEIDLIKTINDLTDRITKLENIINNL